MHDDNNVGMMATLNEAMEAAMNKPRSDRVPRICIAHLAMAIVEAQYELLENPPGLRFCQFAVGLGAERIGKEVTSLSKLHTYCQVLPGQEHLCAHVSMISQFQK